MIAISGFLLVIIASVIFLRNLDDALIISGKSPSSKMSGLVKLVRSFPDEKLPPYPLIIINLI